MLTAAGGWTDLGAGVRVRQSRAFRMNSVVLLSSAHTVVVDPGVLPSELDEIAATVASAKPRLVTLLFTHAHWDHVLGASWWPGAATAAHARFASEVHGDEATILREAESMAERAGESWTRGFHGVEPDLAVSGGQTARLGPWTLAFRDAPGHSDSQICVHVPDRRLLIAADILSDIEIPMLDGPAAVYRRTLESLRPLLAGADVERLVPGHGTIARGPECRDRLERDLGYLEELEFRVRAARAARLTLDGAQEQAASMEYTGRHAEYSMRDAHRDNVRRVWEGIEGEPRP
jgi:glyoxylase-like metal-dependent hydrolase (beta-lactamase superfamily II)